MASPSARANHASRAAPRKVKRLACDSGCQKMITSKNSAVEPCDWRATMGRISCTCLLSVFIGVAGAAEDKPSRDVQRIQGTWEWDPAEKQSDAEPQVLVEKVVIMDDTLTF